MKTLLYDEDVWVIVKILSALVVALFFILCISFCIGIPCAYMESQTYNRLTGAHTTTWDAMWVELRVQDEANK